MREKNTKILIRIAYLLISSICRAKCSTILSGRTHAPSQTLHWKGASCLAWSSFNSWIPFSTNANQVSLLEPVPCRHRQADCASNDASRLFHAARSLSCSSLNRHSHTHTRTHTRTRTLFFRVERSTGASVDIRSQEKRKGVNYTSYERHKILYVKREPTRGAIQTTFLHVLIITHPHVHTRRCH